MINHTDCDSILSSAIVGGLLPPAISLGEAAIAADHTGEENTIADLLQGLDAESSSKPWDAQAARDRFRVGVRNVAHLLENQSLEAVAIDALAAQRNRRAKAARLVASNAFQMADGVAWAVFDKKVDGAFFPALLPDAAVILIAQEVERGTKWQIKTRLGLNRPDGFTLFDLAINEFDPSWGGRWNAGSTSRGGGTVSSPAEYAAEIGRRMQDAGESRGATCAVIPHQFTMSRRIIKPTTQTDLRTRTESITHSPTRRRTTGIRRGLERPSRTSRIRPMWR
ncbi:MAG: hypothetical protein M3Z17_03775 [Gemmatimonadota bacterium]|nr:hypothetical protein [Gemmatimonadota bacterium]